MQIKANVVDIARENIAGGIVEVQDGKIVSITPCDVPADAPYVLPGFVDSHVHIESTLCLPEKFAEMAVQRGVVAAVTDPHEIANVLGVEGIKYMIRDASKVRFHFRWGASSCVPSTTFETAGAAVTSDDVRKLLDLPDVYGLGEVMNVPGVLYADPEALAKIAAAREKGKCIDGHAPGLSGENLIKYIAAGVSTDHECSEIGEAREKIKAGMKVQIREGSAACDFDLLVQLLKESPDSLMMCTDDLYPDEMQIDGYLDSLMHRAVMAGVPLWNILKATCVNPVLHYSIPSGLLREGDSADFIVVDNLKDFNILQTYISGEKVYDCTVGILDAFRLDKTVETVYPNKFASAPICVEDIRIPVEGKRLIKVMVASDGSLYTGMEGHRAHIENGYAVSDTKRDMLKIVVYNRYCPAKPAVAFIKGFGIKKGFIGSTIAHDSHNIIVVGTSDEEIVCGVNRLIQMRGGIVVGTKEAFSELALPVAGLMSPLPGIEVARRLKVLKRSAQELGCPFRAPFMTLAFMALPVIPELKLTDKGLFKYDKFGFTSLFFE